MKVSGRVEIVKFKVMFIRPGAMQTRRELHVSCSRRLHCRSFPRKSGWPSGHHIYSEHSPLYSPQLEHLYSYTNSQSDFDWVWNSWTSHSRDCKVSKPKSFLHWLATVAMNQVNTKGPTPSRHTISTTHYNTIEATWLNLRHLSVAATSSTAPLCTPTPETDHAIHAPASLSS